MITKIKLADGSIQFAVFGLTGDSAVNFFDGLNQSVKEPLSEEILNNGAEQIFRYFKTPGQAAAYIQGIDDGHSFDYSFMTMTEFQMIFGKLEGVTEFIGVEESEIELPAGIESSISEMVQEGMAAAFSGSKYIDGLSPDEYVTKHLTELGYKIL
jgi:hypothetical protein